MEESNKRPLQIQNKKVSLQEKISSQKLSATQVLLLEIAGNLDPLSSTSKEYDSVLQNDELWKKWLTYFLIGNGDLSAAKVEQDSEPKVTIFQKVSQLFQEHYMSSDPKKQLTKQQIHFFIDVIEGNLAAVTEAIKNKPELVSIVNNKNQSPLQLVCWKGHLNLMERIINVFLKQLDRPNYQLLYNGLLWAAQYEQLELVKFILGVAFSYMISSYREVVRDLNPEEFKRHRFSICSLIINNFSRDSNLETPLHKAAGNGHVEMVKFLIEYGADINGENRNGLSALDQAARHGQLGVIKFLTNQTEFKQAEKDNALVFAAFEDQLEVVKFLIECGANINGCNKSGYTALTLVTAYKYPEAIEFLLAHGADINGRDKNGKTALHRAAKAVKEGNQDIAKLLIANEANVNAADNKKNTPLHYASVGGDLEMVKLLIDRGADDELVNVNGETPLQAAVKFETETKCEETTCEELQKVILYLKNRLEQKPQSSRSKEPSEELAKHAANSPAALLAAQGFLSSSTPNPGNNNSNPVTSSLPIDPNQQPITKEQKEEEQEEEQESFNQCAKKRKLE